MAGPTVRLEFTGDTSQLDSSFRDVSSSADKMATDVGSASKKAADGMHEGSSRIADGVDGSERKFQGFADVVGGFGDVAEGFKNGDAVTMATGFADMAGGMTDLVIPAFTALKTALMTTVIPAVWSFTAALLANPITWIVIGIIALIAIIVLLATHWDDVKAAAVTAIQWIGDKVDWVKNRAIDFWNWMKDLPGKLASAFGSIAGIISAPFRAAFNFVADAWNNTIGRLAWTVPGWVPFIGGNTIAVPKLPKFHSGGTVPGAPGSEMLAVLQAGETVIPASGGNKNATEVRFIGNTDSALASVIMELIRTGKIQIA